MSSLRSDLLNQRLQRLAAPQRLACYLAGALALTALWTGIIWLALGPTSEAWLRPDHFPLAASSYLAGTYAIWVGGAVASWLRYEGRSLASLGVRDARALGRLALGLACGLVSLGGLLGLEVALGWVQWGQLAWQHTPISALVAAAGTAAFFGATEEVLFRGFVHGVLRRGYGAGRASALSGAFYALVHFLRVDLAWTQVITPFAGLWLAGSLLAWTFERTGSLYFAIGLHAGWVYMFFLADRQHLLGYPEASKWLTGGGFPLGGLLAPLMVALLWGGLAASWRIGPATAE